MSCIFPHQMFQADLLNMFTEVQRQEKIGPDHSDDAETGKNIFFFFAEEILPLIKSNDWIYAAAQRFAEEFADEYFIMLRLLGSVKENQERLSELREEVTEFLKTSISLGLAPSPVKLTKLSDFRKIVNYEQLSVPMQKQADYLYDETVDLEYVYVNVASQAMQAMYEKGASRIFFVVKRGLKIQLGLKPSLSDDTLLETHQYLNWCNQHVPQNHIISRFLSSQSQFYKTVRNVDSHVSGPKWLPDTNQVHLPDQNKPLTVDITEFSKRYRYLMYFCEIGARGILAMFCEREQGEISNNVKNRYVKMYDNSELKARLCDYPVNAG